MAHNRISATVSTEDRQAVMQAIATIREKLPFLIDLSPEERRGLLKMADVNQAFARRALEVATQNPDFLPRSFNIEEMERDLALYEALQPLMMALTQLQEMLMDTAMAAGGEAYGAALEVYRYAKANGSVAGLDELVEKLGERFAKQANRSSVSSVQ